jgi:asparagine synthase (glutamine-hydrolysing)
MVFNGEIYNYLELRKLLQPKYTFKTQSDSEVLLNAYREWGKSCLNHCNGMFAFAIWNIKEQKLFAARDRFGVKPFYYFFDKENFIFSSEINSIFASGVEKKPKDTVWLNFFSEGSYGLPSETFWCSIQQLEAGHYLTLKDNHLQINKWYHFEERIARIQNNFQNNEEEYITNLLLS